MLQHHFFYLHLLDGFFLLFAWNLEQKEKRGERSYEAAARLRYYRDSLLVGFHALREILLLLFFVKQSWGKKPFGIFGPFGLQKYQVVPKNTKCQIWLQKMLLHAIQSIDLISMITSTSKIPFLRLYSNHSVCYGTFGPSSGPSCGRRSVLEEDSGESLRQY